MFSIIADSRRLALTLRPSTPTTVVGLSEHGHPALVALLDS